MIGIDHGCVEGRLRSPYVVDPVAVGNVAVLVDEPCKVFQHSLDSGCHLGGQETQDGPVRVPVVDLPEPTTRHHERLGHVD